MRGERGFEFLILNSKFLILDAVSVADGFHMVRRRRRGGRSRRADAIDDAAEIAVADRLAVLAERDHRAIDLADLGAAEREAERLAARLHGVAAGVAGADPTRRDRLDAAVRA